MVELLPCPFCGGEATLNRIEPHAHEGIASFMPDHTGSSYVECHCGAGLIDEDDKRVVVRWNRRAPLTAAKG